MWWKSLRAAATVFGCNIQFGSPRRAYSEAVKAFQRLRKLSLTGHANKVIQILRVLAGASTRQHRLPNSQGGVLTRTQLTESLVPCNLPPFAALLHLKVRTPDTQPIAVLHRPESAQKYGVPERWPYSSQLHLG